MITGRGSGLVRAQFQECAFGASGFRLMNIKFDPLGLSQTEYVE